MPLPVPVPVPDRTSGHGHTHVWALATAALTASAGVAALLGAHPSSVVLLALVAFLPYALLATSPMPRARSATRLSIGLALAAGVVLVCAPSVLSDDLYRYLWDGRVLSHGISPYRYAPGDPALAPLRDALFREVSYPDIATIYPPVAQALFALADRVAHHPASLKALALLAHLGTIPVVARLAGDRAPRAALLYGLSPLGLVESALGGHVDVFAGLFLAAAVLLVLRERGYLAALLVGCASGVKLVGLVLAPLLWPQRRLAAVLGVALSFASLVPLLGAGGGAAAGITNYTRRWRGNDGAFAILDAGARLALTAAASEEDPEGSIRLAALAGAVSALRGTPLDLRATLAAEKKDADPTAFPIPYLSALIARALALGLVLSLAVVLARRRTEPLLAARWILLATLLLSPQVHPWYLLWLLPLEIAAGRWAGVVWSAAVLVAYAPVDAWVAERVWVEIPAARALEHLLVVGVLTAEVLTIGKTAPSTPVHVGQETVRVRLPPPMSKQARPSNAGSPFPPVVDP